MVIRFGNEMAFTISMCVFPHQMKKRKEIVLQSSHLTG